MILLRQIYQRRLLTSHRQLRWLCSSVNGGVNGSSLFFTLPCIKPTTYKFSQRNVFYVLGKWSFSTQAIVDHPNKAMVDVPLAQTGEGIADCELLKWFVQEGDQVEEFQPLCEVQSDKATIEITSRYDGKVSQILHDPGHIVKVGETLLRMLVEDPSHPSRTDNGSEIVEGSRFSTGDFDNLISPAKEARSGSLCTPTVRTLAKQYGVDVNDVCGTGKDGRVLREDILNYAVNKGIIDEN